MTCETNKQVGTFLSGGIDSSIVNMFAAYGLSIVVAKKKYKRWFAYWSIIMFVAAIAWNWFKMKGRGL